MAIDQLLLKRDSDNAFVNVQDQFGFYLKWRKLSSAPAKAGYESIPGMNGALDTTEEFGEVFYNPRTLDLDCVFPSSAWHEVYRQFNDKYHAQSVKIAFLNDPNYYWAGRIFVSAYSAKDHSLSMTAKVFPFKFKMKETIVRSAGDETVRLYNSRMPVVPTVKIWGAVSLAWGNNTKSLSSSSYPATFKIPGLRLTEGHLDVTITGSANVEFRYREGSL